MKRELGMAVSLQQAYQEQRLGIINYTEEFIDDCPNEAFDNLNSRIMLLQRYQGPVTGLMIGIFASPEFDVVGQKDQVPKYRIIISKNQRKNRTPCYGIRFEKH